MSDSENETKSSEVKFNYDPSKFYPINVDELEGYYISVKGEIWNSKKEIYQKINLNPLHGYYEVKIKKKSYFIHRLLALTFMPWEKLVVNHINSDKTDNSLDNLEWVTQKVNIKKSIVPPTHKKKVQKIKDGKVIAEFDSAEDASKEIGLTASAVRKALCGKNKTCGGYEWKFSDENDRKRTIKQDVNLDNAQKLYDYDNYFLLETGQIFNSDGRKLLKPTGKNPYVTLCKDNKKKNCYISAIMREYKDYCSSKGITKIVHVLDDSKEKTKDNNDSDEHTDEEEDKPKFSKKNKLPIPSQ